MRRWGVIPDERIYRAVNCGGCGWVGLGWAGLGVSLRQILFMSAFCRVGLSVDRKWHCMIG